MGFGVELTALLALLVLMLVMRWVFARPAQRRGRPVDAADAELGLLSVVAVALPRQDAMLTRAKLGQSAIRSSMSRRRDGRYDVLVFTGDAERARTLLA